MSYTALPPIVRLAERIVIMCEDVVRSFARYHKYQLGSDIREQAVQVLRLAHRAWRMRQNQLAQVNALIWAIDDLKLSLQIAKQLKAFKSFAQFEQLATRVLDLGRQTGGWYKHLKQQQVQTGVAVVAT